LAAFIGTSVLWIIRTLLLALLVTLVHKSGSQNNMLFCVRITKDKQAI